MSSASKESGSKSSKHKPESLPRMVVDLAFRCVLVFLVMEGCASTWVVGSQVVDYTRTYMAETWRFNFDPDLGWVSKPNLRMDDAFGPGKHLIINSQGYRSRRDFDEKIPAGKVRILCTGDSFAWGNGVGNGSTWVELLSPLDPRVEAINMGQNGYGLDQIYLRYKRDGERFEHDVHVFSFIGLDFDRMRNTDFLGMPKPKLRLNGQAIEVENSPIPEPSDLKIWWRRPSRFLFEFRTFEQLMKLYVGQYATPPLGDRTLREDTTLKDLIFRVFEEVAKLTADRNATLVAVYLPGSLDYTPDERLDGWRAELRTELDKRNINFVDLIDSLRAMPPPQAEALFIQSEAVLYEAGHYNESGHEHFASLIYRELCGVPEIAEKLSACGSE